MLTAICLLSALSASLLVQELHSAPLHKLRDLAYDPKKRALERIQAIGKQVMQDNRDKKPEVDYQAMITKVQEQYLKVDSLKPQADYDAAIKAVETKAVADRERLAAEIKGMKMSADRDKKIKEHEKVTADQNAEYARLAEKLHKEVAAVNDKLEKDQQKLEDKNDAYNFVVDVLNGITRNPNMQLDAGLTHNVRAAMAEISSKTCIRFIEIDDKDPNRPRDYLDFRIHRSECETTLGRSGFRQVVWLARKCASGPMSVGHEIMHALGFQHEFKRQDREVKAGIKINTKYLEEQTESKLAQYNKEVLEGSDIIIQAKRGFNDPYCYKSIMNYAIHANQHYDPENGYDETKAIIEFDLKKFPLPDDFYPELIDKTKTEKENNHARLEMFGADYWGKLPECDYRRINELYQCETHPDHIAKNPGSGNPNLLTDLPCKLDAEDKKTIIYNDQEYLIYAGKATNRVPTYYAYCKVEAPPAHDMSFTSTIVYLGCIEPPPKDNPKQIRKMKMGTTAVVGSNLYTCFENEDGTPRLNTASFGIDWKGCGWPVGKEEEAGKDKQGNVLYRQVTIPVGATAESDTENMVCAERDNGVFKSFYLKHVGCMRDGKPVPDKHEELVPYLKTEDGSTYDGVSVVLRCIVKENGESASFKRRQCAYKDPYGPKDAKPVVFGPGCHKIFTLSDNDPMKKNVKLKRDGYVNKAITCEKASDHESVGMIWINYDPTEDKQNSNLLLAHNGNAIILPKCRDDAAAATPKAVTKAEIKAALPAVAAKCAKPHDGKLSSDRWASEQCIGTAPYKYSDKLIESVCQLGHPGDFLDDISDIGKHTKGKFLDIFSKSDSYRVSNAQAARCFLQCHYDEMRAHLKSDIDDDKLDVPGMMMVYILLKYDCVDVVKRLEKEAAAYERLEQEKLKKEAEKKNAPNAKTSSPPSPPQAAPKNDLEHITTEADKKKQEVLVEDNKGGKEIKEDTKPIKEVPPAVEKMVSSGKTRTGKFKYVKMLWDWIVKQLSRLRKKN